MWGGGGALYRTRDMIPPSPPPSDGYLPFEEGQSSVHCVGACHSPPPPPPPKENRLPAPPPPKGASSQSGWGLMQGPGLGSGHPSLPGHEAEQPDCLISKALQTIDSLQTGALVSGRHRRPACMRVCVEGGTTCTGYHRALLPWGIGDMLGPKA